MQFLVHLVRSGVLTAEQAIDAIDAQLRSMKPLGKLALESRMMTVREVMTVLERQAEVPDIMFGETAVELGFLTQDKVAALLATQRRQRLSLDQVLINMGGVPAPELAIIRQRYRITML